MSDSKEQRSSGWHFKENRGHRTGGESLLPVPSLRIGCCLCLKKTFSTNLLPLLSQRPHPALPPLSYLSPSPSSSTATGPDTF